MSADEIIKHIPEITHAAETAVAAVPFTAIVKRMLGPAADELAEMWADKVKMWRFERQASCVEKAETMLRDAGITPHTVSPKILFSLLEGASFEDNEDLLTMFSALLANAASAEDSSMVRPGFVAILKQMSSGEALMLEEIAKITEPYRSFLVNLKATSKKSLDAVVHSHQAYLSDQLLQSFSNRTKSPSQDDAREEAALCAEMLRQYGLLISVYLIFVLSPLGEIFYESCRPPKPKF